MKGVLQNVASLFLCAILDDGKIHRAGYRPLKYV